MAAVAITQNQAVGAAVAEAIDSAELVRGKRVSVDPIFP